MKYRNYLFSGPQDALRILSAFLFDDGFEGVQEQGKQLQAYIAFDHPQKNLGQLTERFVKDQGISYTTTLVEDTNWNAQWESNFEPIRVDSRCLIRAEHHAMEDGVAYDIVIQPKMSFGTGHHPTTYLMVSEMLGHDFSGKSVFDYGTGTGVLAILAEKKGASEILAVDIDPNCIENVVENLKLNHCNNINFAQGDIDLVQNRKFSFVLANITRNTLLSNWMQLFNCLDDNGILMISGFYTEDAHYFETEAKTCGLSILGRHEKDSWLMMVFKK